MPCAPKLPSPVNEMGSGMRKLAAAYIAISKPAFLAGSAGAAAVVSPWLGAFAILAMVICKALDRAPAIILALRVDPRAAYTKLQVTQVDSGIDTMGA